MLRYPIICAVAPLILLVSAPSSPAQPLAVNSNAFEAFKDARELMQRGKFDLAAEQLKAFLAATPTDADLFTIQSRFGNSVFLQLRNVLRWSDNDAAEKEARATVEEIVKKSDAATKAVGRNPARIQTHIRNLAGSREERLYAQMQLKQSGDAVMPVMVELLRSTNDPELRSAILTNIPTLIADTVPGFLAALEGLPNDIKGPMLEAIANRPDVLALVSNAETDFTPHLWYYAGLPPEPASSVRATSIALLNALTAGVADKKKPEAELTRLAQPFAVHAAGFRTLDKVANKVKISTWDADKLVVKVEEVTPAQAEEYFGLKYLRWAIERNPAYEPAQIAFVSLATERAVERAKFGDLSKTEPGVYQLLSAAPAAMLTGLLQTALAEKRTALALGLLQAIGDRAQKEPLSGSGKDRPSPAVQALSYPDPRVQFAAALALLRSPGAPRHGQSAKIVEILRRALSADADGGGGKLGRAIIADPSAARGDKLVAAFREAGYSAERFASGRALMRRLGEASDYDLIVIDRHIVDPLFADTLTQVNAEPRSAGRPIVVVASSDLARPVPFEHLLLRLALLIAATETEDIKVPEPYVRDPNRPLDDPEQMKIANVERRDNKIDDLAGYRIKRMKRIVEAADINTTVPLTTRIGLRIPQLVYAVLAAEYKATATSAPRTVKQVQTATLVVRNRSDLDDAAKAVKDTDQLIRLMDQIEATMNDAQKKKFEDLRERVPPEPLGLEFDTVRDLDLEASLLKAARPFRGVRVIPEPFSTFNLKRDIQAVGGDPAAIPRDAAEKKTTAKLAGEWLRRLALDEVPGYDVKPAEGDFRKALADDELAPDAAEALARIGTGDAQVALVSLALQAGRPAPIRLRAGDAAIRHAQGFGKLTNETVAAQAATIADSEPDAAIKAKLGVLARLVAATPPNFGAIIKAFPVKVPQPPVKPLDPKDPKDPKDPVKEPKN